MSLAFDQGSKRPVSKGLTSPRRNGAPVRTTSATSWFPQHHARDIYVSLLSHQPPLPPHILSAALLRRAVTDVARVVQIRDAKAALSTLLQKSLIGDAFWNEFLEAEKELEAEIKEVVEEANTFNENWGKFIFAQASDMAQHQKFKNTVKELSTPMPRVQLVQQLSPSAPGGGPGQPAAQNGPAGLPRLPPNMTPEQVQKIQEAAAKMTPQQRAAMQAQFAMAQQQQQAKAAAAAAGSSAPSTTTATSPSKGPLTTSAATNQDPAASKGDDGADGKSEGSPTPGGQQNQAPTTPSKSKVSEELPEKVGPFCVQRPLTRSGLAEQEEQGQEEMKQQHMFIRRRLARVYAQCNLIRQSGDTQTLSLRLSAFFQPDELLSHCCCVLVCVTSATTGRLSVRGSEAQDNFEIIRTSNTAAASQPAYLQARDQANQEPTPTATLTIKAEPHHLS